MLFVFFCILMYYFIVIILYIVQIIIKKNTIGEIAHAIKENYNPKCNDY